MEQFSSELIAILGVGAAVLGVGVGVAGLVLQQGRRLDSRIDGLAVHVNEQYRQVTEQHRQLIDRMNEQHRQLTDRMNEQHRQLTEQMNEQHRQLTEQMNERFQNLSDRVARVEGKLDLFETVIAYRNEPPAAAAE